VICVLWSSAMNVNIEWQQQLQKKTLQNLQSIFSHNLFPTQRL